MKGVYSEENQDHQNRSNATNMFVNLQQPPPPQFSMQQPHPIIHHPFSSTITTTIKKESPPQSSMQPPHPTFNHPFNTTTTTIKKESPPQFSMHQPHPNSNHPFSTTTTTIKNEPPPQTSMHQPHPTFHHQISTTTLIKNEQPPQFYMQQTHPTFHNLFPTAIVRTQNHPTSPETNIPIITTTEESSADPSSPDGVTSELPNRPRGRPRGSKNKPKPPIIIIQEPKPPMSAYVLQLTDNIDMIENIMRFCRERVPSLGLSILCGFGVVADVTLQQPSTTTTTFHGLYHIISISATILPNNNNIDIGNNGDFTIFLGGPQGQVFGGAVVGPLKSAGIINLIAVTICDDSSYERLSLEEGSSSNGVVFGGHAPAEVVGMPFQPPPPSY